MFELTDTSILVRKLPSENPAAGGWVSFEGRVRSQNEGKDVVALEYEIYGPVALAEGRKILAEAKARFGLLEVYGIHRSGRLAIGDTAIWVYAAGMHRREAFEGVDHIVHAIKHQLPIWKKEFYADGTSGWVNCSHRRT